MATSWEIGDRIEGRWEIYQIMKGGMGIVYIVYDHEHQMPYAAKTFCDERFADDSDVAADFTKEALTWVNLDAHENVTRAEFVQTIRGKPFLFLEYVSGGDLKSWIGTPRLTEDLAQVLRFAIQFCDGMNHAVAKGIKVHRDIKPRNCLITEDHTLKVTDFGLAKAFDDAKPAGAKNESAAQKVQDSSIGQTRTGTGAGTCTHMAPEQFDDVKQVAGRADIYSFGVVLFEMITGKLPFAGETWEELKQQHQTQAPLPLPNSVPPLLIEVVNTCLSKNPWNRFADFIALRQQLAEIYEKLTGTQAPQPVVGAKLDAVGWSNKGVSLSHLQRHEEALTCYDYALGLNTQLKEVWNNKGLALRALGRHTEALACYDQALTLDPSFALAWNNKGWTFEPLGRHAEAVACYDHALKLNPQLKEAWNNKALTLGALGRYPEALACYDHALTLDPPNAEMWSHKGGSLQALGRHAEALACYDHALTLDSRNAEAWSHRGSSLQALGRHGEALASYNHAFTLDPYVVSGKFRRWAVRALLRCQRRIKTAGKSADQECDQQQCSTV